MNNYGFYEEEKERERIVFIDIKWLMPKEEFVSISHRILYSITGIDGFRDTKFILLSNDRSIDMDTISGMAEKLRLHNFEKKVHKIVIYEDSEISAIHNSVKELADDTIYMIFDEKNLYDEFPGRSEMIDLSNIEKCVTKLVRQLKYGYWWDISYRDMLMKNKKKLIDDGFKKVIFLDIDGVLNDDKGDGNIDEDKVALLSDIVKKTNAEIVLSSSWRGFLRRWIMSEDKPNGSGRLLFNLLAKNNLTIADATEEMFTGPDGRPFEIRSWLTCRDSVVNFVILDDENFWRWNWLAPHVVLTETIKKNDKDEYRNQRFAGLNRNNADKAIQILTDM